MSLRNTFFSSQDLPSQRSSDLRRDVFKIFSDTLAPPTRTSRVSKTILSKINKRAPRARTPIDDCFKPGFPSFTKPKYAASNHCGLLPDRPLKATLRNAKKRSSKVPGGGEGNFIQTRSISTNTKVKKIRSESVMKDCHLSNVLRSARRCLSELQEAKGHLSDLVAQDQDLSRGIRKQNPTDNHLQLADVSLTINTLCRDAFVPAHRLNQTAISLYTAEDFLRYPTDLYTYDLQSTRGRIRLPDRDFNTTTVQKLQEVLDSAALRYAQFKGVGQLGENLHHILFRVLRGYQDLYAVAIGCQEIFKVLLYAGPKEKAHLQQFLLALSPVERSDLLVEVQELRRILDEIVIFLEKLSWGSFIIYKLAGGELSTTDSPKSGTPDEDEYQAQTTPSLPLFPKYSKATSKRISEALVGGAK